jgi:hypothetical protein
MVENQAGLRHRAPTATPVVTHILSLTPFRRIVKDYFLICESYYEAIRTATPSQIEAIDMGRRGLHNEGSQLLMERLKARSRSISTPPAGCSRWSACCTGELLPNAMFRVKLDNDHDGSSPTPAGRCARTASACWPATRCWSR